jgi:hypothetical protein
MGLFSRIFYGVDLDEEQERADRLDRELAALNAQRLRDAKYSKEQFEAAEANRIRSQTPDIDGDVRAAFDEGLDEGASNIRNFLGKPFEILPALPKIIPWQVWVAVGLYVAWRFGLFKGVTRRWQ